MTPAEMWKDIVAASGLQDLACEQHDHDLLDPEGPPNAPLVVTFMELYRREGCKGWGVESVLRRMRTVPGFEGLRVPDEITDRAVDRAHGTEPVGIAHHTSIARGTYQSTWGTPQETLEIVRGIHGPFDLDLCSSAEHNLIVQAKAFFSAENPCPKRLPAPEDLCHWCNPPGPGWLVRDFWAIWCDAMTRQARGGFLIYNADHWRYLPAPPMPMVAIVLRKRQHFRGAKHGANFPSVLVLSGEECSQDFGHAMIWS